MVEKKCGYHRVEDGGWKLRMEDVGLKWMLV